MLVCAGNLTQWLGKNAESRVSLLKSLKSPLPTGNTAGY